MVSTGFVGLRVLGPNSVSRVLMLSVKPCVPGCGQRDSANARTIRA